MTTDATPLRFRQQGEGWHLNPKRNLLFKAGGIVVLVVFVACGLARLVAGHPFQGLGLAVVGAAFCVLPFDRNDARLPTRTVTVDGERGLLVPTHPVKVSIILAMTLLGALLLVGAVAAVVEAADQGKVGPLIGAVVIGLFGVFIAIGAYGAVQGRRARDRGLLLLPDALVMRTSRRPARLPWTEIAGFRDHWTRPGRKILWTEISDHVDNWLSVEPVPGATWPPDPLHALSRTPNPTVRATALAIDPVEALALLRLHLERPDLRAGLAEGR